MSIKKSHYLQDGANKQAKAVLAYIIDEIETSWDGDRYVANIEVSTWVNGREKGYVLSLKGESYKDQLNIAFFEHRNSDDICAIEWEQVTLNPPTIETIDQYIPFYKNKYDVTKRVSYGEVVEMADWINERLEDFWNKTKNKQNETSF